MMLLLGKQAMSQTGKIYFVHDGINLPQVSFHPWKGKRDSWLHDNLLTQAA